MLKLLAQDHLFVHLLKDYSLSAYCISDTLQGLGDTAMKKHLVSQGAFIIDRRDTINRKILLSDKLQKKNKKGCVKDSDGVKMIASLSDSVTLHDI